MAVVVSLDVLEQQISDSSRDFDQVYESPWAVAELAVESIFIKLSTAVKRTRLLSIEPI